MESNRPGVRRQKSARADANKLRNDREVSRHLTRVIEPDNSLDDLISGCILNRFGESRVEIEFSKSALEFGGVHDLLSRNRTDPMLR